MNYQNKIILVTGGSRGIGSKIASYFLEKGAKVIVTYHHNKENIEKLKEKYSNLEILELDLKNEDSIRNLFMFIKDKYKRIDILINNAAKSLDSFYLDKTKEEFMEVIETNLIGTFLMIKYFQGIMDKGYIFNMSSTDGIDTGSVYSIDYNASKAGINMLTKTISLDNHNTIISICPNWVDTDSTRRMYPNYLESELKRIKQEKLIDESTIPKVIDKCIREKVKSGSIIRIDGDIDV